MRAAAEHDLVLRVVARPGRFVVEGEPLFEVVPAGRATSDTLDALAGAVVLGGERTHSQDLQFSIDRLVEIAQRALSPGVNDPATALYCVDRLREALLRLAGRPLPSPLRLDERGHLRLLTEPVTLEQMAIPALASVRATGRAMLRSPVPCWSWRRNWPPPRHRPPLRCARSRARSGSWRSPRRSSTRTGLWSQAGRPDHRR